MKITDRLHFPWMDEAECRSAPVELFYARDPESPNFKAKDLCNVCTVRLQCLEMALTFSDEHGLWGGCTPRERRRIARQRRNAKRNQQENP